jgi:hypothetical protein
MSQNCSNICFVYMLQEKNSHILVVEIYTESTILGNHQYLLALEVQIPYGLSVLLLEIHQTEMCINGY